MADYIWFSITLILISWLGITVYRENRHNAGNQYLAWFILWMGIWSICNFFEGEVLSHDILHILFRIDFAVASLAALSVLLFCLYFPVPSFKKIPDRLLSLPMALIALASLTPLVVKDVVPIPGKQPEFRGGDLYEVYTFLIFAYSFSGLFFMLRKRSRLTGLARVQTSYVLLGMSCFLVISIFLNLIFAYFFSLTVTVSRIGIFGALPLAIFPSYAILRYRLMDIRVLMRDTSRYVLVVGLLSGVFSLLVAFISEDLKVSLVVFIFGAVMPILYSYFDKWLKTVRARSGLVDRNHVYEVRTVVDRIKNAGYKIADLAVTVSQIILDQIPSQTCAFFVFDHDRGVYSLEGSVSVPEKFIRSIPGNDPLVLLLESRKETIVKSEAQRFLSEEEFAAVSASFTNLHAEVCAPLIVLDRVAGIICLGSKRDGRPYFVSDLDQLDAIVTETATALRYVLAVSRAASETKRWAHTLNQSLKPLSQAFEFLKMGEPEPMDPDREEVFRRIRRPMSRLAEFLHYLTHQSRIIDESLRNKYELSPVDMDEIIRKSSGTFTSVIERRKIKFISNVSEVKAPILGHMRDLVVLFEALFDNALRYVPDAGKIEVFIHTIGDWVRIRVANDGVPIPEENIEAIFQEGFQIKNGHEGVGGLGLANARRIIEMHGGKIWAENTGNGRGVAFIIELPLQKQLVS